MKVTRSVIPNLFTVVNLFCGFASIVHSMEHDYAAAAIMIVLGGIFDGLDGMMARLTRSSSEFGVELDSLADLATFGLAPSVMVYTLYFNTLNPLGMLLAALPAICGALRLARFNVQLVGFDKNYFRGLPIPAAAVTIVSFVYFHYDATSPAALQTSNVWLATLTILTALLMVSTIKYETIPKLTKSGIAAHPLQFAVFLIALTLIVATTGKAVFPLCALYILFGAIRSFIGYIRHRLAYTEEDEDVYEEDDSAHELVR
jgi:CDP-diacylglycerol--serine O-phosphatidyltransferase